MRKKLFSTAVLLGSLMFYSACSQAKMPGSWVILDTGTPDAFYTVNFVNDKVGFLNASTDRNYVPLGVDDKANQNANQNANTNTSRESKTLNPATHNGKKKVDPLKANDGFEVLQTTDGGETWKQLPEQFKYKIRSVWFVDPLNGWALTIDRDILRTTDGAKSWTTQRKAGKIKLKITANRRTPEMEQPEQLERVFFIDTNHGWAWGGGVKNDYAEQPGIFLTTVDGGQNWNAINYPFEQNIFSAFFLDPQRGWVNLAEGGLYKTTDGGVTWTKYQSKTPELTFDSIFFVDDNNGWVAGHSGRLAKTTDGGKTWTKMVDIKAEYKMRDLFFSDKNHGYAVGDKGAILYTADGGESWAVETPMAEVALRQVFFINPNTGWAVGLDGAILRHEP
ncbi:MAG: hypothetical protein HY231_23080 [Acidobacteria bacterium]|nr:hypothetical protein [Acidobacteriota bacterium]